MMLQSPSNSTGIKCDPVPVGTCLFPHGKNANNFSELYVFDHVRVVLFPVSEYKQLLQYIQLQHRHSL